VKPLTVAVPPESLKILVLPELMLAAVPNLRVLAVKDPEDWTYWLREFVAERPRETVPMFTTPPALVTML
jgi:hypothetical protein